MALFEEPGPLAGGGDGLLEGLVEEFRGSAVAAEAETEEDGAEAFADVPVEADDFDEGGGFAVPEGVEDGAEFVGLTGAALESFRQALHGGGGRLGRGALFADDPAAFGKGFLWAS